MSKPNILLGGLWFGLSKPNTAHAALSKLGVFSAEHTKSDFKSNIISLDVWLTCYMFIFASIMAFMAVANAYNQVRHWHLDHAPTLMCIHLSIRILMALNAPILKWRILLWERLFPEWSTRTMLVWKLYINGMAVDNMHCCLLGINLNSGLVHQITKKNFT